MTEANTSTIRSDSLTQILKANPHSPWRAPLLWWRWRRAQFLYQDFSRNRIGLNDYERELLVPELVDRLKHMAELFGRMRQACKDPGIRAHIGPAIAALGVTPQMHDPVREYLDKIVEQIETMFLKQIADLIAMAPTVTDVRSFIRFGNGTHYLCGSILATKETLFWYSAVAHVLARERATGKVLQGEPKEFAIILMPFTNYLENLVNIAAATDGTIQHWRNQQDEVKKPFLDYLSASAMHSANRLTIVIQLLSIAIAVVLSAFFLTAADPFNLKHSNVILEQRLRESERLAVEQGRKRDAEAGQLRSQFEQSQRHVEALSAENARLRNASKPTR